MGCFQSKQSGPIEQKYKYSYEDGLSAPSLDRSAVVATDFLLSNLDSVSVVRAPGQIGGQAFSIEECSNSDIYLCDHIAQVTVDVCRNCTIFIGPTAGPVFLRNCSDCRFIVACQQFRTRDCENCDVLLFAANRPIIEASRRMRFGCFSFFYFSLKSQFNAARLSVFNNTWSDVYDFSPASDNFAFLSHQGSKDLHSRFLTLAAAAPDHFSIEELSMSSQAEVVPFTLGKSATLQADTFLLLFPPSLNEAAKVTVSRLASSTDHVFSLALSREVILTQDHLAMLFAGSRENRHPSKWCCGPSIGLQIIGGSFSSFAGHLNEVAGASVNDVFGTDDSAVIKVFFERLPEQV